MADSQIIPNDMRSQRIEWIPEIRGFLALYVVGHHAVLNIDHSGTHDVLWRVLDALFGWGHMRVDVFFVLSAFCLALPLPRQRHFGDLKAFMLRRSARLLPTYYVACVVSFVLATWVIDAESGTHWDVSLPLTTGGLLTHALLIHQWWPQYAAQMNHALWSIGVEYQLCLLLPVFDYVCRRFGPWKTVVLFTIVGYAGWKCSVPLGFPNPSPWGASIYYVSLFAIGVATAYLYKGSEADLRPRGNDLVAISSLFALMIIWVLAEELRGGYVTLQLLSFFVGIATACLLLWTRTRAPGPTKAPRWLRKALRFIGDRSYSLYLIHAPMLQLVWLHVVRPMQLRSAGQQAMWMIGVGAFVSVLSGLMLYAGVERHSVTWSRHLGRQRQLTASASAEPLVA